MADLAELPLLAQVAGFGDSRVAPGDEVYVIENDSVYTFRNTTPFPTPDGVNFINATFLRGFWERTQGGPIAGFAVTQRDWYVDSINGSDSNSGTTAVTALKTELKRQQLWGVRPFLPLPEYHIYYLNDMPTTDVAPMISGVGANPSGVTPTGTTVYLHGSATPGQGKTILASLSVDAVTAVARPTNVPLQITANSLPVSWTASGFLNTSATATARCRMTSGANINGIFWAEQEAVAKKATCNEANQVPVFSNGSAINVTTFTPALNDTFVVESLTVLNRAPVLDLFSFLAGSQTVVVLDSLDIRGTIRTTSSNQGMNFWGCYVQNIQALDSSTVITGGCRLFANGVITVGSFNINNSFHDNASGNAGICSASSPSATSIVAKHMIFSPNTVRFTGQRSGFPGSVGGVQFSNVGIFGGSAQPPFGIGSGLVFSNTCEIWGVPQGPFAPFQFMFGGQLVWRTGGVQGIPANYFYISLANVSNPIVGAWACRLELISFAGNAPAWDLAASPPIMQTYRNLTPANLNATVAGGGFQTAQPGGGIGPQWFDPITQSGMAPTV